MEETIRTADKTTAEAMETTKEVQETIQWQGIEIVQEDIDMAMDLGNMDL